MTTLARTKILVLPTAATLAALTGCAADQPAPEPSTSAAESSPSQDAGASSAPDDAARTSGAADTLAAVESSGRLRVCTTGDYRPYTYLDPETDEWSGIDISMADAFATALGVELELVQTTWAQLLPDLNAHCDMAVGGISFNDERAKEVDFSTATVQDGKAPIARCTDVEKFQSIEDINQDGVRVITPIGGTNEKFAGENFPEAEVITWDDNNTIFDQILAKDADVMVTDASEAKWVAHQHEGELCAINPDEPFTHFENGYLLPQGDAVWQQRVNAWLAEAVTDGTYADAEEPWFG